MSILKNIITHIFYCWYSLVVAVKAVIFDCFGVLYPVYVDNFYKKHVDLFGGDYGLLDKLNNQIDLGQINQAEFYAQLEAALHIPSEQIMAEMEENLVVDKQLVGFIKELSKNYKLGLLSNAGEEEIQVIYRDGLDSLFDAITVSYEVGDVKPNPKIFTACLQRLDVKPEESVFVDDSAKNLEGAQQLGIGTILYPDFGTIPEALSSLVEIP